MIIKNISDRELQRATAMVRCAMLDSLPEDPDGQFSEDFLKRIAALRAGKEKIDKRQRNRRRLGSVAAAFFIAITMLLSFNTEVRAAVVTWFKEVYDSFTTYWFIPAAQTELPIFELTEIPEGFICIYDESLSNSRSMLYQNKQNQSDIFSIRYALLQADAPLTVSYPDTDFIFSEIEVNGFSGELYISKKADESHALVWIDEHNGVVFTITSLGDPNDMLHIAGLLELVK